MTSKNAITAHLKHRIRKTIAHVNFVVCALKIAEDIKVRQLHIEILWGKNNTYIGTTLECAAFWT
jgi:hypothetical protein